MGYSVRTAKYRYNEYIELATGKLLDRELYDVVNDPDRYTNLVGQKNSDKIIASHKRLMQDGWRNITVK
jgi:hypothetical protein